MSEIKILDDSFEPKAVYNYFMEITQLYPPSGEEEDVREYVIKHIKKTDDVNFLYYKPDAKVPGKRVIVLRRKGLGNYARVPYVTFQAHMDMVCSP